MNVSASVFQERVQTALALVCSTLHLTALPPLLSLSGVRRGYNVQGLGFHRSIVKGPFRPTCLCEGLSLTGKVKLTNINFHVKKKFYIYQFFS